MASISLETGQLVFVKDVSEGWVPATVGSTHGQGEEMSVELIHDNGRSEVSLEVINLSPWGFSPLSRCKI